MHIERSIMLIAALKFHQKCDVTQRVAPRKTTKGLKMCVKFDFSSLGAMSIFRLAAPEQKDYPKAIIVVMKRALEGKTISDSPRPARLL